MRRVTFDLDALRSFVTGMELGSFAKAAERLGRSPSAVSSQLHKLEEQAGTAIFRKAGRNLALTDAGEVMLSYARRLIDLNDEAAAAVRGVDLAGGVRLGLQEDFGEALLPQVLGRFVRAHPKLRIEARVARNAELRERLLTGMLDVALLWGDGEGLPHGHRIAELPMRWIGPAEHLPWRRGHPEPLPLALFEGPCLFRTAVTEALDRAGIPWRMAFTGPNLSALWAAASAGLGITVRTAIGLPASLRVLDEKALGLPSLPPIALRLHQSEAELPPPAAHLVRVIVSAVEDILRTPGQDIRRDQNRSAPSMITA